MNDLLIIVPAFNEAENIAFVVEKIRASVPDADILVINDGSTDGTREAIAALDVINLNLPFNLGIGGAVQAGFLFAKQKGYARLGRVDGDGQHDPAQMPKLLQTLAEGDADVVIGSRFVDGAGYLASWQRAIGIQLFARTVSLMTRQRFTDTTSGFQVHNRAALSFLADNLPTDYPEIEGLILLKKNGFKVKEVGVTMLPRRAGSSSITAVHSIYYIFKVYIAILVEMLRKPVRSGDE